MSAHMVGQPSSGRIGTPPPQRIADTLLPSRSTAERRAAAAVIHVAIGVGSGALFGLTRRRRRVGPVAGAIFGLGVWAVGYELMVPALGVLPPAHRDEKARRAALIQAHLIYGAILGALS
jgi:hypothetical protein